MGNIYHYERSGEATFYVNLVSTSGLPANPDSGGFVMITIKDSLGSTILEEQKMTSIRPGYFVYDWPVPYEQALGEYSVISTATIDTLPITITDKLYIVGAETEQYQTGGEIPYVMTQRYADLIGGLFYFIREAQEIPVRNERAKQVAAGSNFYKLTFGKWNQSALPEVRRNKIIMATNEYDLNYDSLIEFKIPISPHDVIDVSYNFAWFDMSELAEFVRLAVEEINFTPPGSNFLPGATPANWDPAVIYGSASHALRRLIFALAFQQPQLVYGLNALDRDGVNHSKDVFQSLLTSYSDLFLEQKKWVKRSNWPSGANIVVPEYTLPGGRSRWFRYLYKS